MLLRYKKRDTDDDKYQYTIHSEYFPPMDQADSEFKSTISFPPGSKPTPRIDSATNVKAVASFFMTGMTSDRTEDTFKDLFHQPAGQR